MGRPARALATGYLLFYFAVLAVAATVNLQLPTSPLLYASIVVLALSVFAMYCVFARKAYFFLAAVITLWSALAILQVFMGYTIALADLGISLLAGLSLYVTRGRYKEPGEPRALGEQPPASRQRPAA